MKAGLLRKFKKFWSGPYKVIRKISDLNYKIVSQDNPKADCSHNSVREMLQSESLEPLAK